MSEPFRLIVRTAGGPDVIERVPLDPPAPGPGELRVRHMAVGVNFIDTYHRSGLYPLPMPTGLGSEAAGVVEAVGEGVTDIREGDRVTYLAQPPGSYATHGIVSAARAIPLPAGISDEIAAAALLKGMTAEFLIERCARITAGQTVLVHAAAGGVGSILVQWLKAIGATVIAHVGSEAKAETARGYGADHVLSCPFDELPSAVTGLVHGGVEVALDGVGTASWEATLGSMARRGLIVSYGNASGPPPAFTAGDLARRGSLFVTRPTLFDYIVTPEELHASAARLFAMIGEGKVKVSIGQRFALAEAAEAHRALESRATQGSTVLVP